MSLACTGACLGGLVSVSVQAEQGRVVTASLSSLPGEEPRLDPRESFRGWEHLVGRLHEHGVPLATLRQVYQDPRMPRFTTVYFQVKPRESSHHYKGFLTPARLKVGRQCLADHLSAFRSAEKRFGVDRHVLAAIALVETNCGRVLGRSRIIERLSRLAAVMAPENLRENVRAAQKKRQKYTQKDFEKRGQYLEDLFLPELPALLAYAERERLDPLEVRGSYGGAFGIPQFLPTSLERYGVDGNGDGHISLFVHSDAVHSAANFLRQKGWKSSLSYQQKREVVRAYNNSESYIDTVLGVASRLSQPAPVLPVAQAAKNKQTAKHKQAAKSKQAHKRGTKAK